ncbi:OmpP1/FadL family transporter [Aureliella helgolandensis]|uniref:Outer membrane protein transport protein (OMPP1/FadL/TodX) n=1 Tax=Aureliella helgolandensis TaxID=2527968 RepID=A0A518G8Y3_9BACT|nr:outer membrane protein transport protein [Aureliella helgolandensis]QDV25047.1 Outer membrane protein transport protein (OMPP1/FadL/TodX) [Aureliella helgolandensis]
MQVARSAQKLYWTVIFALLCSHSVNAQGLLISAAGPVNRSMGGASTAAPIDALGALYWNPATISGLAASETEFSLDLLFANHTLASTAGNAHGETEADPGVFPIPNIGWVHKSTNPALTYGLGVNAVAGFKTNLQTDPSNPVLAPQAGGGLGRVSSEASFMQLAPVISYSLTERLSIAAGPTITTGQLGIEPFVFDSPNSNGYSSGRSTRYHWGAGFQVGAFYIYDDEWRFGASLKSPTWMEKFDFNGEDATGGPRTLTADIDLPLVLSLGTSYAGIDRWLFACDVRFVDYANTAGLGDPAEFDGTGRLVGLDWSSVLATALGAQFQVHDGIAIRGGYTYNQNPVSNNEAFFNVASPLIYQHMLSTGLSIQTAPTTAVNIGYSYMLDSNRTGPIFAPGSGALAGTSVENSLDAHFLSFGLSVYQ